MTDRISCIITLIAEYVDGGCADSLETICERLEIDFESLSQKELDEIDENFFECQLCNWYLPADDRAENNDHCTDCAEHPEED